MSVLLANQTIKDRFFIFWIEKNGFRPEKWSFKKVQKIELSNSKDFI